MNIYKVTKSIAFCYGHRLLRHRGKCRYLHGHNAILEVDIEADRLNEMGMVMDFSDIQQQIRGWIDANIDHKMLLWDLDPVVGVLTDMGETLYLMDANPTAENISKHIFEQINVQGLAISEVRLWENPSSHVTYRRG